MELCKISVMNLVYADRRQTLGAKLTTEAIAAIRALDANNGCFSEAKLRIVDSDIAPAILGGQGSAVQQNLDMYLKALITCHSVVSRTASDDGDEEVHSKNGALNYEAESPDEAALVMQCACLGYVFRSRIKGIVTLSIRGTLETWKQVGVVPFSSARKRMTVLMRDPEGKLLLIVKGADSVILKLLKQTDPWKAQATDVLNSFSREGTVTMRICERCPVTLSLLITSDFTFFVASLSLSLILAGLRTLCTAGRYLSTFESEAIRGDVLPENFDLSDLEKDLDYYGSAGIEDKLQDGVPDAIQKLLQAGVKVSKRCMKRFGSTQKKSLDGVGADELVPIHLGVDADG
jgi:phospholipid-translocating ATPase